MPNKPRAGTINPGDCYCSVYILFLLLLLDRNHLPSVPLLHAPKSKSHPSPQVAFNIQSFRRDIDIAFRVEVCNPSDWLYNSTFRDRGGNMSPRDATRPPDAAACSDHFNIRSRHPGPFISMFTNWNAALEKRKSFIDNGATDVVIFAVWLKGLARVYYAYDIAWALGLSKLDQHFYEVLLLGGISADQYRILAEFDGVGQPLPAALSVPGLTMAVRLPPAFIRGVQEQTEVATSPCPSATNRLRDEMYMFNGTRDDSMLFRLALCIGGCGYTSQSYDTGEIITPALGRVSWKTPLSVAEA